MENKKKKVEYFQLLTEGEIAEETGIKNIVTADALLYDIKYLIKWQYVGCFNVNGDVLEVAFNNGDAFEIRIKELKSDEKDTFCQGGQGHS